ncbi:MAG: hypothetical protein HF314_07995 [Ignavibacteria bacterium]|nr:hypothetical protein [Ignavibacteria bacterium]MCU7517017.1 hypothetical protein [Ignavibacteria bacterium]
MKSIRLKATQLAQICLGTFILVTLCSCNRGYSAWEKNKLINGIEFEKIRYGLKDNDTTAIIGYLKANTIIEQYPCAADWVHFTKDWKLKLFRLCNKTTINNFEYCKNSWIRFTQEGSVICVFPEKTLVQGFKCIGGGGPSGISTSFYKSGRLNYFYSDGDILVDNILCKSDLFNNIGLHENGKLKECTLAQDKRINSINYKKGTRIFFDEAGMVKNMP